MFFPLIVWFIAGLVFGFFTGIFAVCLYGFSKVLYDTRSKIDEMYKEEIAEYREHLELIVQDFKKELTAKLSRIGS